jgi:putative FmdB family regulatory protein
MPIYEYRCSDCGFQDEYLQKISEPPLTSCPSCGKATFLKLVSAAGFQLKGSGWYQTDFRGSYVTPYLNEAQIISGTLAYAIGMGKAVVSTPYWHAQELLAEGRGRLVPFRDPIALAREVINLLDFPKECRAIRERAYQYGRKMIWSDVARRYLDTFADAKRQRLRKKVPERPLETLGLRLQPLPDIKLDHLRRMTDGTGVLQHARYTVPDRTHGYCVDDNARALIVTTFAQELQPWDVSLSELAGVCLSFQEYAFNAEGGGFRDLM